MKIHGTAKGGALSKKDFGVAFGAASAPSVLYPDSMGTDADLTNSNVTLDETDEHLGTGCWSFNGTDAYVDADPLLDFSTTVGSISMWVYTPTGTNDYYVLTFGDANANEFIAITNEVGKARVHCRKASTDQWKSESASDSWTYDAWHNIMIVQNGTAVKWYWDGTEQTSFSVTTDKSAWISDLTGLDNVRIGAKNVSSQGTGGFGASLTDSICFWNIAISSSLVAEIYNSGTGITIPEISSTDDIKAFYSCDSIDMENDAMPIS